MESSFVSARYTDSLQAPIHRRSMVPFVLLAVVGSMLAYFMHSFANAVGAARQRSLGHKRYAEFRIKPLPGGKHTKMKFLLCLVVSLVLTDVICAQDLRDTSAAKAACGPSDIQYKTELVPPTTVAPQSGKALLYIVQVSDFDGSCLGRCGPLSRVGLNASWLGATEGNSFLSAFVDPGIHHLCANWDSHTKKLSHLVALHSFIAEPNKIYFFEIHTISSTGLGGGSVDFSLSAIDEDEGRMLISAFPESK